MKKFLRRAIILLIVFAFSLGVTNLLIRENEIAGDMPPYIGDSVGI